jgi:hypothetical protein
MWHVMTFTILFALTIGFALWRGGAPERLAALTLLVASVATMMVAPAWHWVSNGVDYGVFVVDLVTFAALVAIALNANRFWPIWLSATHGLSLLGHVSVLFAPDIKQIFYAAMVMASAWPGLALLAVGTYRHHRRISAGQPDPAWTRFTDINERPTLAIG